MHTQNPYEGWFQTINGALKSIEFEYERSGESQDGKVAWCGHYLFDLDSAWASPIQVVPKKRGVTVVKNEDNELLPTRQVTDWRVCIDYYKLNNTTRNYYFPLQFIDQMFEHLVVYFHYFLLDGVCGYYQIPIVSEDQEKTTFTCSYGTFAFRRTPFHLCNAPPLSKSA